jgi:tRNA(fMet)-specific endonuclease VapC
MGQFLWDGPYGRLGGLFAFFAGWNVLPLNNQAADQFQSLRKAKVRISTMDLKIASIVLVNDGLLLSANTKDFGKVSGLSVENWLN